MAILSARGYLVALAVLAGCVASESSVAPPTATEVEPEPEPEDVPEDDIVPPPEAARPSEAGMGDVRCEGLVGRCGGWTGCVMVRPDPTTPGRLVGVGESAGHFYVEDHRCHAGVCNELCGGGSESVCRPGLAQADALVECSAAVAPSHAPFTCALVEGACVQGPDPRMMPAS